MGTAPHLEPIDESERKLILDVLNARWLKADLEGIGRNYASEHLAPEHYREVQKRREQQTNKIMGAVHERLLNEINYLEKKYLKLAEEVKAGKQPQVQAQNLKRQIDELAERLKERMRELESMKSVFSSTPHR